MLANARAGGCFVLIFLGIGGVVSIVDAIEGIGSEATAQTTQVRSSKEWSRPTDGAMETPYQKPGSAWISGYHTGVDFVVQSGTPVLAAGAGRVVTSGWGGQYGNQVVIQHGDGTYTQYAHLSRIDVRNGEDIPGGHRIGLSGDTGNASGPHLHFEVRTGPDYGSDINPVKWLRHHGVTT